MAADSAFDPGETEMQIAAIQVSIDHIHTSLLLVVLGLFNGKYLAAW